jgi:aryl-alcohol dehydrogenase-like predicted oxidoreductase
MGMSGTYGPADDAANIATAHAAREAGISVIDTGEVRP